MWDFSRTRKRHLGGGHYSSSRLVPYRVSNAGKSGGADASDDVRVHSDGTHSPERFADAIAAALQPDLGARGEAMEAMAHAATLPFEENVELGQAHCQRCEIVPRNLKGPGSLLVNLPHTHTIGKVLQWLRRSGLAYSEQGGTVTIAVPEGSLAPIVQPLVDVLSPTERKLTRVVFQPLAQPMQLADYFRIEDVATFAARAGSDWLLDLLREGRFTCHFQPIVAVDDARTLLGYECLLRGKAKGESALIPPGTIFDVARKADLVFQVDQAARRSALRTAAKAGIEERIFVNFTPDSIFDAAFCLDATVRVIDDLGLPHERIVFEIVESERLPETDHLRSIVDYYRDRGFGGRAGRRGRGLRVARRAPRDPPGLREDRHGPRPRRPRGPRQGDAREQPHRRRAPPRGEDGGRGGGGARGMGLGPRLRRGLRPGLPHRSARPQAPRPKGVACPIPGPLLLPAARATSLSRRPVPSLANPPIASFPPPRRGMPSTSSRATSTARSVPAIPASKSPSPWKRPRP